MELEDRGYTLGARRQEVEGEVRRQELELEVGSRELVESLAEPFVFDDVLELEAGPLEFRTRQVASTRGAAHTQRHELVVEILR
ncbi:hypothetical protein P3T76_008774 [Phytophthora citrophthora]|uniref:Uncharacterized protein n=1 Tax=Phytophthora citrophthora TaxID=4793 RepID=A0AAD9GJ59_9STRA|nr:hypothetical protein P3T76_008774 [Phytophthora citrophthora]